MKTNPKDVKRLIDAAMSARESAYCPYSRYPVGAAVMTETGRIFAGCNVENASYGLAICAERSAVFAAIAHHQNALKAVCVAATGARPCGACRQVLFEFSTKDTELIIVDIKASGRLSTTRTPVHKTLPYAFDPLASGLLPANPRNLLRAKGRTK